MTTQPTPDYSHLDPIDQEAIAKLQASNAALEARIEKLTPHDSVIDALPWDGTGHNGSRSARRIEKRRDAYLDRTLDAAAKIKALLREIQYNTSLIDYTARGEPARDRARKARIAAAKAARPPRKPSTRLSWAEKLRLYEAEQAAIQGRYATIVANMDWPVPAWFAEKLHEFESLRAAGVFSDIAAWVVANSNAWYHINAYQQAERQLVRRGVLPEVQS